MSHIDSPHPDARHAWRDQPRVDLPKRSAVERVADFLEVYGPFDESTAREQASRCIQCPEPQCVAGCPLGNRIPEWLALTAEGHFLEAAGILHATSALPEICARCCPADRLCEATCILGGRAEPVSIWAIEQFLNEYAFAHGVTETASPPPTGQRVAVIGSGPGGLTCAEELRRHGHAVTVFDAQLFPGGLLVNGTPAFKVDKSIVERRVESLKKRGVEFRLGVKFGEDLVVDDLQAQFDAVYLGCGARKARTLEVPGAGLAGVIHALPFIMHRNAGLALDAPVTPMDVSGQRVAVLGGGNVAVDCLRTALRCGAREVVGVYRRDEASLPCTRREYECAIEEGARFIFQAVPVAVLGGEEGRVRGLRLARTQLGEPDASGRPRCLPCPGGNFEIQTDWVLVALGFEPAPLPPSMTRGTITPTSEGTIRVDENLMTEARGVFAGGDLVRGPTAVLQAVRDARRAAACIHGYLLARRVADLGMAPADNLTVDSPAMS